MSYRYINMGEGEERVQVLHAFCMSFVPEDVRDSEEEVLYFLENLTGDHEFVLATRRELHQCATGERVESIEGDQMTHAVFTVLPMDALEEGEGGGIDIVREVAFVSADGIEWTAEG